MRMTFRASITTCILLLGLMFLSTLNYQVTVGLASEAIVTIQPQDSSTIVGQTFEINITLVDVQNLYGVETTLTWNASILTLAHVDVRVGQPDGVLHEPSYIAENTSQQGLYVFSATSLNPAPAFTGNGTIARMTFTVVSDGSSKLDLEAQLYDWPPPDRDPRVSLPIAHFTLDGSFSGAVPEFSKSIVMLVFAMLMSSLVVILRRRKGKTCSSFEPVVGLKQALLACDVGTEEAGQPR